MERNWFRSFDAITLDMYVWEFKMIWNQVARNLARPVGAVILDTYVLDFELIWVVKWCRIFWYPLMHSLWTHTFGNSGRFGKSSGAEFVETRWCNSFGHLRLGIPRGLSRLGPIAWLIQGTLGPRAAKGAMHPYILSTISCCISDHLGCNRTPRTPMAP